MKDEVCGAGRGSAWKLTRSYILGPWTDEIICFVDRTAASDPPPRYYFTKDRLNSTRELISASATVVTSYDYDVWGTPTESHLSGNLSTRYRHAGWLWAGSGPAAYFAALAVYFPDLARRAVPDSNGYLLGPLTVRSGLDGQGQPPVRTGVMGPVEVRPFRVREAWEMWWMNVLIPSDPCYLYGEDARCQTADREHLANTCWNDLCNSACCGPFLCCAYCWCKAGGRYHNWYHKQQCKVKDLCCASPAGYLGSVYVRWCGPPPWFEETRRYCEFAWTSRTCPDEWLDWWL